MRALVVLAVAFALARSAQAYPQYQLARDQTCTGCHISPSGGGLLTENGLAVAAATARWSEGSAAFTRGVVEPPGWLQLGGDARFAAGLIHDRELAAAAYPMQAELYASAASHGFSLNVTGGFRAPQEGDSLMHVLWSREHYVMWQAEGLYVRAGRFMPVYGLRLAEHAIYTERYGGLPLYGDTYAAAVEYVSPSFEAHLTAFAHDPIGSAVEHGDGGAFYSELRLGERAAVGVEARYSASGDLHVSLAGATGKLYLAAADVLLQAEVEVAHDRVLAGGAADRAMGYLLASRPIATCWLLDVGVGHYSQDLEVKGLYRDALDANLHWFVTAHTELLLNTRLEALDRGAGPIGAYALAQLHYRL